MPVHLPSTKALRTFFTVATTLSFSKAAEKLCISQGAVSKQISALEQQLGQALFFRRVNGIELTEAGKTYLPQVSEAIHIIQSSTANLLQSDHTQDTLTVSVTPSFASLWLTPRIKAFLSQHSDLRVNIRTGDEPKISEAHDNDVIIRCLPISHHYEQATLLCQEKLLLIGSAELIKRKPIKNNDDLFSHTFIPHITRPELWEQFKLENKLGDVTKYHAVGFEHYYLSLAAAMDNQGLALVPDFMARAALKANKIVNPLGYGIESHFGYYTTIPHYKRGNRAVCEFEQWIYHEIRS
ncbi:LysR family transcriptional regulator [Vibrio sp. S4M6]|uniref:LysR family transcriptional regulator n=1 Tax=Vibrio sinus TaxID=2946865 RepID=UPI00202A4D59|nr:LysR family transcriptional regulator [Vibrio sinus]MCL9782762.1 LysR family transcriptional regulator [Vibrio sinus]